MATLTIVQQNIRNSITAVNEIKNKLNELKPDILLLQEPYSRHQRVIFDMSSRICHHEPDSPTGSVHVASIILNPKIVVKTIKEFTNTFCTTIGVSSEKEAIIISNVYVQPNQMTTLHIDFLTNLAANFSTCHLIVCGDFNSRSTIWYDSVTNRNGTLFKDIFNRTDLMIQNDKTHTCITHNGSSLIDLTLTNIFANGTISDWRVERLSTISDHKAIIFRLNLHASAPVINLGDSNWSFSENKADWENYARVFEVAHRKDRLIAMTCPADVDRNVQLITDQLIESAYKALPISKKPTSARTTVWNKELEFLRLHFHNMRNLYMKKKVSKAAYNKARNRYVNTYNKTRRRGFWEYLEEANSNNAYGKTFKLWKKRLTTAPKDIPFVDALDVTTQKKQMKQLLDQLFPDDDCSTDNEEVTELRGYTISASNNDSIEFEANEVSSTIEQLKPKKAPGIDRVSNRMIKSVKSTIVDQLADIFNCCINLGYFPLLWKTAKVIVLPKPGKADYSIPKAYRPIALTPHLSKILEKLIRNRLQDYLLLNVRQHGFKQGCSTITALRTLTDLIIDKKDKHRVAVVAIDISGAFDNAFWPAIFRQLDKHGVPAQLIKIVQSYLNNRIIKFNHQGIKTEKELSKGTPQGGVLSPLLWNIILDEMLVDFDLPNCELIAYADDVTVVCWDKNEAQLRNRIIDAMHRIKRWCESRKLAFCSEKTNLMYVHCEENEPITIGRSVVEPVLQVKILGVTFGDHKYKKRLNFHPHVLDLIARATRAKNVLFALARKSWGINSQKRLLLFRTVIRPMLTYASEIWFSHLFQYSKDKLDSLQYDFLKHAIQAFNSVSYAVTHVMADTPKLCDFIQLRLDNNKTPDAHNNLMAQYHGQCNAIFCEFFPGNIPPYVKPNFHNMQFFSGHGHFRSFLKRIAVTNSDECDCGQGVQDVRHLLFQCPTIEPMKHGDLRAARDLKDFVSSQTNYLHFDLLCRTISNRLYKERKRT